MSFLTGNFFYNGKPLSSAPLWGMSVLESGNMRFRWNETNSVRDNFFSSICAEKRKIAQPELIHSKTVYEKLKCIWCSAFRLEGNWNCKGGFFYAE